MNRKKKLPIGMASFEGIIRDGRTYVDKTELMWKMIELSKYIFLSRPRRFGKSLLVTTLRAYFEGKRELFEGMKITELEKEWIPYPVIRLDLSLAKARNTAEELRNALAWIIEPYEELYGKNESNMMPGERLNSIIKKAFEQTGKQVVLLVDEYDAPMLDVVDEDKKLGDFRQVMQEFYMPLKASEDYIKFCFITGITKFSQLSIFSTINNLANISLLPEFATICGITEEELEGQLADFVEDMAAALECSSQKMLDKLRERYDGYHFANNSQGVYNPFSLINALMMKSLNNYWFSSGTPTFLIKKLREFNTDASALEGVEVVAEAFDLPTEALTDALPLLYQSGYLTIKDYNPTELTYTLGIPNQEVRIGLSKGLLPTYTSLDQINNKGYALPYATSGKKVVKVGIEFDPDAMTAKNWVVSNSSS